MGIGGIAFHLSQMHTSALFPKARGLVSGTFVAGFSGSGLMFFILRAVVNGLSGSQSVYRGTLLVFSALVALWIPIGYWIFPRRPMQLGQVYVCKSWRFRPATLHAFLQSRGQNPDQSSETTAPASIGEGAPAQYRTPHIHNASAADMTGPGTEMVRQQDRQRVTVTAAACCQRQSSLQPQLCHVDHVDHVMHRSYSNDHQILPGCRQGLSQRALESHDPRSSQIDSKAATEHFYGPSEQTGQTGPDSGRSGPCSNGSTEHEDVSGRKELVVVPEAAKFAALKTVSMWRQLRSPVVLGLGIYFLVSVVVLQLYLGTSRLQLRAKGDTGIWANWISVVFACGFVFLPLTFWLTDRKGFGATIGAINMLGVISSTMQAVPSLGAQAVTIVAWSGSRAILYSSFYAIVASLVGFRTFGSIIGAISAVTGLVTLSILPISNAVNAHLQPDRYWVLNVVQVVALLPLFGFAGLIWKWERTDVVLSKFSGTTDGRPINE